MLGTIITFGQRAATIQTENKQQFYAPCEQLSRFVISDLLKEGVPLSVVFKIDYTRHSGHANHIPRYFALNIELIDLVLF
jgi:hypothetical protein